MRLIIVFISVCVPWNSSLFLSFDTVNMTTMQLWTSFVLISGLWISVSGIRYHHFDDYLSSLDIEEESIINNGLEELDDGSGEEPSSPVPISNPFAVSPVEDDFVPLMRSGFLWSKDVSCCSLGQLAGDKGYHCYANFYAARILLRNKNRAHNKKMGFYGRDKIPNYGNKLMQTFEQCVARRGKVFHKCCHLAVTIRKTKTHYDSLQKKRYEQRRHRIANKRKPTNV